MKLDNVYKIHKYVRDIVRFRYGIVCCSWNGLGDGSIFILEASSSEFCVMNTTTRPVALDVYDSMTP